MDWALFDTPIVAPRLPVEDAGWPAEKLLLADRYRDARVLYLGDSRIFYGIDPNAVSKACACGPGYNAAFPSADIGLTSVMADRVLQKLTPEVVVVGLSQWELSDAADIPIKRPAMDIVEPWKLDDLGLTVAPAEQLDAAVSAAWRLYRHRAEVRAALTKSNSSDFLDPSRRGFDTWGRQRPPSERDLADRERQWFGQFSVDGQRANTLRHLLTTLHGRGLRVVLVAPPLHQKLHDRVRPEVELFRAAARELASEGGAPFVDFTQPRRLGLDNKDFQDVVHLDAKGAETLSRHLGQELRSHLHPHR